MRQASLIALLVANLIIAAIVLLQDWGYYALLIAFWLEAVIIGFFNVGRVLVVFLFGDPFGPRVGFTDVFSRIVFGLLIAGFFVAKFGTLALGVGFWIFVTPGFLSNDPERADDVALQAFGSVAPGIPLVAGILLLSHGLSFVVNFILRQEFRNSGVLKLLFWPYARLAFTALVLIGGLITVFQFQELGVERLFTAGVLGLKLFADLLTHLWEHRGSRGAAQPAAPA